MIFHILRNLENGFRFHGLLFNKVNLNLINVRFLYEVRHSVSKNYFYVSLDKYGKEAILDYNIDGQVIDLRSLNVPVMYKGRGLARLLTETAFTFAILNDYYLYLTCPYTQKYYLANKTQPLRERIIGPEEILDIPVSLDLDSFEELPDPQDPIDKKS